MSKTFELGSAPAVMWAENIATSDAGASHHLSTN